MNDNSEERILNGEKTAPTFVGAIDVLNGQSLFGLPEDSVEGDGGYDDETAK